MSPRIVCSTDSVTTKYRIKLQMYNDCTVMHFDMVDAAATMYTEFKPKWL